MICGHLLYYYLIFLLSGKMPHAKAQRARSIFKRLHRSYSGRRSPPVYRGRGPRSGEGVRNTPRMATSNYSLLTPHFFRHPLTAKAVPSPYKLGESAVRSFFTHRKGYSLLPTTYYLLPTTYYLNSFSPFKKNPSRNASSDWDFYNGCNGTVNQYRLPTFGISNFIEAGVDVVQRISLTFCAGYDDAHLCYLTFFRVLTPELDKL